MPFSPGDIYYFGDEAVRVVRDDKPHACYVSTASGLTFRVRKFALLADAPVSIPPAVIEHSATLEAPKPKRGRKKS